VAGDLDSFAADVWDHRPWLSRAAELPASWSDLLEEEDVDELVSQRGLRTPFLRVAREGATFSESSFTASGGVGAGVADQVSDDKLVALFADGATLVLQGLHRAWPPLIAFSQQLAGDLGHPVQVNAYVTPPQNRGFDDHYDVHDVFVLQVGGRKRWRIHAPVHPIPLRDQPWTAHRAAIREAAGTEPLLDVVLNPGDCLYLPRGQLHAATALGGISTHLTVGVHPWTRWSLAEELVAEAMDQLADDPDVRAALGVGAAVDDATTIGEDLELVRSRLAVAVAGVSASDVAPRLGRRARSSQRAAPVGPLAQLRAANELHEDRRVALRRHLAGTLLETSGGGATLRSRAGDVLLTSGELPAVRQLLVEGSAAAGELGLDLTRRLISAAVLVIEPR
jgi:hypothetical protein